MTIRRATAEDAEALALVGAATFLESYCLDLAGSDIVRHCAKHHTREEYEGFLADAQCALWVLEVGQAVTVGFALLTPSVLPAAQGGDLELRRIYVLHRFQGGGHGRRLVEVAAEEARKRGAQRLTLGTYGENWAAHAFYRRLGFEVVGERTFQVGDRLCQDLVFGLAL